MNWHAATQVLLGVLAGAVAVGILLLGFVALEFIGAPEWLALSLVSICFICAAALVVGYLERDK